MRDNAKANAPLNPPYPVMINSLMVKPCPVYFKIGYNTNSIKKRVKFKKIYKTSIFQKSVQVIVCYPVYDKDSPITTPDKKNKIVSMRY